MFSGPNASHNIGTWWRYLQISSHIFEQHVHTKSSPDEALTPWYQSWNAFRLPLKLAGEMQNIGIFSSDFSSIYIWYRMGTRMQRCFIGLIAVCGM